MTMKSTRLKRSLTLALGAVITCSLVTGTALSASADTPSSSGDISQLVQKYGRGTLKHEGGPTVKPNVEGLVPKRQAANFRAYAATALPSSYSLKQYAMPVGDQKAIGSCVTWAIGYSMLGWYSMYAGQYRQYAPMYIYSQDHYPGDGGSTVPDAYNIIDKQGIVTQGQYPQGNYNWTTKPTASQRKLAAANKATAPHWLYDVYSSGQQPGPAARTAIETAISQKHPVALSIDIYEPFYDLGVGNSVLHASQIPGTQNYGGHEVLIVGYNSTGVIIQNQWGTQWGDYGYATLDWDFVEKYSYDATWISGFEKTLPAQVPAAVDNVEVDANYYQNYNEAIYQVGWNGTAGYDDSVRHPVTRYVATLTGSDGSSQTLSKAPSQPGYSQNFMFAAVPADVDYTLNIAAVNAVGTGPATTYTFPRATSLQQELPRALDAAAPAMPAPKPLPAVTPGNPSKVKLMSWYDSYKHNYVKERMTWSKPKNLGRSTLNGYRIKVVGKKGSKTKYSHTFSFKPSAKSKTFTFSGKYHLVHGLSYTFTIAAKNKAGYWSPGETWRTRQL